MMRTSDGVVICDRCGRTIAEDEYRVTVVTKVGGVPIRHYHEACDAAETEAPDD